jgi:O-antigen/teichoic acid export membrane protein
MDYAEETDIEGMPNEVSLEPAVAVLTPDETPENVQATLPQPAKKSSRAFHLLALCDQAIVSVANFLTGIVLARSLSLGEFGKYSLVWMGILFGANIQMSLIISPMMSIGPIQRRLSTKSYLGSVLTVQIVFSLLTTVMLAVIMAALSFTRFSVSTAWLLPILAANLAYQLQDFLRRVAFFQKRLFTALTGDVISYIGQLAVIGVLIRIHRISVVNVLWANAVTSVLAILFVAPVTPLLIARVRVVQLAFRRNWQSARYLLAATLMQWTSGNFFVLIAPTFLGVDAVGALRACQSVMNMTNIWMQGLENSLPAEASRVLTKSGLPGLRRYVARSLLIIGGGTAVVVLVITIAPEFWLKLLYGPHLKGYGVVLRAYGVISFLSILTMPLRAGLRSLEYTKPIFSGYIMTTVYSLISAPLLAWAFGMKGLLVGIVGVNLILIPKLAISLWKYRSEKPALHSAKPA